ncbi:hypothetical protein KBD71_01055 [Candidatus Woesebacteria bacterium]|nr:hypothetical protein [Candidatus Woesebacteria bacterium]
MVKQKFQFLLFTFVLYLSFLCGLFVLPLLFAGIASISAPYSKFPPTNIVFWNLFCVGFIAPLGFMLFLAITTFVVCRKSVPRIPEWFHILERYIYVAIIVWVIIQLLFPQLRPGYFP